MDLKRNANQHMGVICAMSDVSHQVCEVRKCECEVAMKMRCDVRMSLLSEIRREIRDRSYRPCGHPTRHLRKPRHMLRRPCEQIPFIHCFLKNEKDPMIHRVRSAVPVRPRSEVRSVLRASEVRPRSAPQGKACLQLGCWNERIERNRSTV